MDVVIIIYLLGAGLWIFGVQVAIQMGHDVEGFEALALIWPLCSFLMLIALAYSTLANKIEQRRKLRGKEPIVERVANKMPESWKA